MARDPFEGILECFPSIGLENKTLARAPSARVHLVVKAQREFFDGKAVGIELPQTVELTVVETEPGLKSATASSVTKPAKTETGLIVQVPPFINEGEKIKVDTSEGAYLSRA